MQAAPFRPESVPTGDAAVSPAARPPLPWPGLALLMLLALVLRAVGLGAEALWFDEVNTLWRVAGGSLARVLARIAGDVQAPLYDLAMWVWTGGASLTGEAWVRWPSVACSVALLPLTAALAREWGVRSRRGLLLAAALPAFSTFQVNFAQEARPYALLALLSGVLLLAAARLRRTAGEQGLLLLACAGPALALTHYYGVLLLLAVSALLLLDAAACAARLSRLLLALLPALVGLLLWAPVALRQFSVKEMNAVYRPLDGPALLEVLDAQGTAAALAVRSQLLEPVLGPFTGAAPAALWLARGALLILLLVGVWGAWRCRRAPVALPRGCCRTPQRLLLALGALTMGLAWWLPAELVEAAASALLKQGRPLDAENLAALAAIRKALLFVGAGLALLGPVFGLALPAFVRRVGLRLSAPALGLAALLLPLLAIALLDRSGKHTLATRNLIGLAPACAALVALGAERLARRSAGAATALLAGLLLPTVLALAALPAFGAKADWRGAAASIQRSGAEPLAQPPWISRCVEFHTGRPWGSVHGSGGADAAGVWAASRRHVVLVRQFEALADAAAVTAVLTERFGPPRVETFRGGVRCEFYGGP